VQLTTLEASVAVVKVHVVHPSVTPVTADPYDVLYAPEQSTHIPAKALYAHPYPAADLHPAAKH
jgi:LysM repeat protein